MALSQDLLAILRCSESKKELIYFPRGTHSAGDVSDAAAGEQGDDAPFLFCPASRLRYPIAENDLPVMLVEEATRVDDAEAARLVAAARELGLSVPEDAN